MDFLEKSLKYFSSAPRKNSPVFKDNIRSIFQYINGILKLKIIDDINHLKKLLLMVELMCKLENEMDSDRITRTLIGIAERIHKNSIKTNKEFENVEDGIFKLLNKRRVLVKDKELLTCIDVLFSRKREQEMALNDIKQSQDKQCIVLMNSKKENIIDNSASEQCNDVIIDETYNDHLYTSEEMDILTEINNIKSTFRYRFEFIKHTLKGNISYEFMIKNSLFIQNYYIFDNKELNCSDNYDFFNIESIKTLKLFEDKLIIQSSIDEPQLSLEYIYKCYCKKNYLRCKKEIQLLLGQKCNIRAKIFSTYFIIMAHISLAEFFEAIFYLQKIIKIAYINCIPHVYTFFLDLKFTLELIAGYSGPRPNSVFIRYFEDKYKESISLVDPNFKYFSNWVLKKDISIKREIRTLNRTIPVPEGISKILHRFPTYAFISCFTFEGNLCFNIYSLKYDELCKHFSFDLNFSEIFSELKQILNHSNSLLKNIIGIGPKEWWGKRYELDNLLFLLLKKVNGFCKIIENEPFADIFLICDEITSNFPFESLGIFESKNIYRIPSFEYLAQSHKRDHKKPIKTVYYLLDPGNNLPRSCERISQFFSNIGEDTDDPQEVNIKGVIGRNLTEKEWSMALKCDLFLYFGHGSGKKYMPAHFRKYLTNNNVFLFGCSSSKLICHEDFKRNGQAIEYLNKVNSFIGCLWDVTDKDLDIFSMEFLGSILRSKAPIDISLLFRSSLKSIKLKYLNGAALVLWGCPTVMNGL